MPFEVAIALAILLVAFSLVFTAAYVTSRSDRRNPYDIVRFIPPRGEP